MKALGLSPTFSDTELLLRMTHFRVSHYATRKCAGVIGRLSEAYGRECLRAFVGRSETASILYVPLIFP